MLWKSDTLKDEISTLMRLPCQRTLSGECNHVAPSWISKGQLWGLTIQGHLHLTHAVPFLVSGTAGQDPYPTYSSVQFLLKVCQP